MKIKSFFFLFSAFLASFLLSFLFIEQTGAVVRSQPPLWFSFSPDCSITVPSQAKANEEIDIDVSGSSDIFGILTVNFSSDNILNGSADGNWDANGPYNWNEVSGAVAFWKFDQGSGQIVSDSAGYGNEGTLGYNINPETSDPSWTTESIFENALQFDGLDDFVNIGDNLNGLDIKDTSSIFTIELWTKLTTLSPGDNWNYLINFAGCNTGFLQQADGSLKFEFRNKDCTQTIYPAVANPQLNTWYHLVASWNGSGVEVYVNGNLVASQSNSVTQSHYPYFNVRLGVWGDVATTYFQGLLDEVRIYNRALLAEEILNNYNNGKNKWNEATKIKKWSFADLGDYEVWAEITNIFGQNSLGFDTISVINQPPDALISCDASLCSGGSCNGNWIAYRPTADPDPCLYTINNNSTDLDGPEDIIKSEWYLKKQGEPDSAYLLKSSCGGVCDYTLQIDITAGDYVVKLYVEDSKGASDNTTHSLTVKKEVTAGFMCSLDNLNWQNCQELSGIATEGELVYFKDDPSLAEYSIPSQGSIISRVWQINEINFDADSNQNPVTNLIASDNTIRLTVTDSANRTDFQEHAISALSPLPEWKEIPPVFWLKKFLASLWQSFDSF